MYISRNTYYVREYVLVKLWHKQNSYHMNLSDATEIVYAFYYATNTQWVHSLELSLCIAKNRNFFAMIVHLYQRQKTTTTTMNRHNGHKYSFNEFSTTILSFWMKKCANKFSWNETKQFFRFDDQTKKQIMNKLLWNLNCECAKTCDSLYLFFF